MFTKRKQRKDTRNSKRDVSDENRVKKLQNENKQENIPSMQTAGKKNRSTMDNLIMMNAIIEGQRQDHKDTYILYADAEKCVDKLWLKDSLIEMERIGYNKNYIKMLYEINKTTENCCRYCK